jgi:hypothetical protein
LTLLVFLCRVHGGVVNGYRVKIKMERRVMVRFSVQVKTQKIDRHITSFARPFLSKESALLFSLSSTHNSAIRTTMSTFPSSTIKARGHTPTIHAQEK